MLAHVAEGRLFPGHLGQPCLACLSIGTYTLSTRWGLTWEQPKATFLTSSQTSLLAHTQSPYFRPTQSQQAQGRPLSSGPDVALYSQVLCARNFDTEAPAA